MQPTSQWETPLDRTVWCDLLTVVLMIVVCFEMDVPAVQKLMLLPTAPGRNGGFLKLAGTALSNLGIECLVKSASFARKRQKAHATPISSGPRSGRSDVASSPSAKPLYIATKNATSPGAAAPTWAGLATSTLESRSGAYKGGHHLGLACLHR